MTLRKFRTHSGLLLVQEGVMLHRVVPWLWRLADDDATRPEVPEWMQQELLEALRNCPAADEIKVGHV